MEILLAATTTYIICIFISRVHFSVYSAAAATGAAGAPPAL